MAHPLSRLEDLAEQFVEGTFARVMQARLQPIEVARHIARSMEDGQMIDAQGQIVVPNDYKVFLHPTDFKALQSYQTRLQDDLVRYVLELARAAGATMPGRPRVALESQEGVTLKRVRVQARLHSASRSNVAPGFTQTMPAMYLPTDEEQDTGFVLFDGSRRIPISGAVVTIGRNLNSDIILDNKQVSRRHAQLRRRYGQYILYDLGSTGGTRVNGKPVHEAVLESGQILEFAGVKLRFEQMAVPGTPSPNLTQPMPPRRRGGN